MDNNSHSVKGIKESSIQEGKKDRIADFFSRDNISRQAPGKRYTKTVKKRGQREVFQNIHLMMTMKRALSYKQEFPQSYVHISTFYNLLPEHILLSSNMPHNVYIYRYLANFNYLVEAVHKNFSIFPKSGRELSENIYCNLENEA